MNECNFYSREYHKAEGRSPEDISAQCAEEAKIKILNLKADVIER